MFQDAARRLGLEAADTMRARLAGLRLLTPGDLATVLRQARLNAPGSATELLGRLEGECQLKPESRRKPLGFSTKGD